MAIGTGVKIALIIGGVIAIAVVVTTIVVLKSEESGEPYEICGEVTEKCFPPPTVYEFTFFDNEECQTNFRDGETRYVEGYESFQDSYELKTVLNGDILKRMDVNNV